MNFSIPSPGCCGSSGLGLGGGCCCSSSESSSGGGGGSSSTACCALYGAVEPEGVVTASPYREYYLDDGVIFEKWIKRTGVNTNTGWFRATQYA